MQTFLPHPDFAASAAALDPKRLGKQRVETLQVVRATTVPGYGWQSHPAVLMWRGHLEALGRYGLDVVAEWVARGFGDTCGASIRYELSGAGIRTVRTQAELAEVGALPAWLGDEALHRSHRSALLRKDPGWYGARFPGVPDDLPYVWPVRSAKAVEAERRRAARSSS
ncbi:MSMEG_6728 family protein [Pseudonocardia humida]|uniref:MSMEG_6728 family protein n=1 Tax=Pseudonocardia humida TaxID=2800819 RepID=A0ABT1AAQ5_9PSEU|nr:MSMEG_6728 family protein [Pseudonocardia humida]MCO1660112.1 MSMEG_6728 family protein [Pseudonocardia humida]